MGAILIFLLGGCGKKKTDSDTMAFSDFSDDTMMTVDSSGAIPVLDEQVEDFFDDDPIAEFAFVDDEVAEETFVQKDDEPSFEDFFADVEDDDSAVFAQQDFEADDFFEDAEDFDVAWEEDEFAQEFETVYFDFDRNSIREDQKITLNKNIGMAKEAVEKGKDIVVGAHCCQIGADSYNLALSERRANAIKKEMVKSGVPEEKIKTVGYGKELPVVWTDKTEREDVIKELAANRRGEITAT